MPFLYEGGSSIKGKTVKFIIYIFLVISISLLITRYVEADSDISWNNIRQVDLMHQQKSYDFSQYTNYSNSTINITQYPLGQSNYNDVQMRDDTRLQYMTKFNVTNDEIISVVGASNDTNLIGGENTNNGKELYWSIGEYDINGNLLYDGDWRQTNERWVIGKTQNSIEYGAVGYAKGIGQKKREADVAYIMVVFRWNDGNLSYEGGYTSINKDDFLNIFDNLFLCIQDFNYNFDGNGGEVKADLSKRLGISNESSLRLETSFPLPTLSNYRFVGWKVVSSTNKRNMQLNQTYCNDQVLKNGKFYSSFFGDMNLQAQWEETSPPQIQAAGTDWINTDYHLQLHVQDGESGIQKIELKNVSADASDLKEEQERGLAVDAGINAESDTATDMSNDNYMTVSEDGEGFTYAIPNYNRENTYIYDEVDYSLVFDPQFYAAKYEDLKEFTTKQLLAHFVNFGMKEGRQASVNFNLQTYRENNADVAESYAEDFEMYYIHYMNFGAAEGRKACDIKNMSEMVQMSLKLGIATTEYNGINYEMLYDPVYYAIHNPDVVAEFGFSPDLLMAHFVTYGMEEGRQASANFAPTAYLEKYEDLRDVFGTDIRRYYEHYQNYGAAEGRSASDSSNLSYVLTQEGVHSYVVQATDNHGNRADTQIEVKIDKSAPQISCPVQVLLNNNGIAEFQAQAKDQYSGMKSLQLLDEQQSVLAQGSGELAYTFSKEGNYFIVATDLAGNPARQEIKVITSKAPQKTIEVNFVDAQGKREYQVSADNALLDAPAIRMDTGWKNVSNVEAVRWTTDPNDFGLQSEQPENYLPAEGKENLKIDDAITYYAIYRATATLIYDTNGGTKTTNTEPVEGLVYKNISAPLTLQSQSVVLADCSREEIEESGYRIQYIFTGWKQKDESGIHEVVKKYDQSEQLGRAGQSNQSDQSDQPSQTDQSDQPDQFYEAEEGSADGTTGSNKIDYQKGEVYDLSENVTLVAAWKEKKEPIQYTIAYEKNCEGLVEQMPESVSVKYDQEIALSDFVPVRPGFTFMGWNLSADGMDSSFQPGQKVKNMTDVSDDRIILYAQWQQKKFKLIQSGSTVYHTNIVVRTEGDENWFSKVGRLSQTEQKNITEDQYIQIWHCDRDGQIWREK